MDSKAIRFIAILAVISMVVGNNGIAHAAQAVPPIETSQRVEFPNAPSHQVPNGSVPSLTSAGSLGVQFVHVATAANSDLHTTLIDHPLTNGNPAAMIIVTPNYTPGVVSGTLGNDHIGVFYNGTKSQWGIYNEDGTTMLAGTAFNVIIPSPGSNIFVQTASTTASFTTIDNAITNGNPNAMLFVTPNYNPGNIGGTNANFPVAVLYNNILNQWQIINQTGLDMAAGTAFNVLVLSAGPGIFVHQASSGNTTGLLTSIDNALVNGDPNALIFATQNFNPGGVGGTLNEHPIGMYYSGSKWTIVNKDSTSIPLGAAFNVLVLVPNSAVFVHTATPANSVGNLTLMDNALTNSNPNAVVFATPNLNPGGGTGTYNNQNIGVTYNGSQWRIFNQNGASIPAQAAFNVLVPNPDARVFVHTATAANINLSSTKIDYPLVNGNPNAILLVTQNYNPGNVGGSSNDHPIGVVYSANNWWIFNQDLAPMSLGAAFNVFVPTAGPSVEVFVHTATTVNSGANLTSIDSALANGNPNAIILVTPNYNPGGAVGVYANFPIGVAFAGDVGLGRWAIVNQNGPSSSIPLNAAFNVYVYFLNNLFLPLVNR